MKPRMQTTPAPERAAQHEANAAVQVQVQQIEDELATVRRAYQFDSSDRKISAIPCPRRCPQAMCPSIAGRTMPTARRSPNAAHCVGLLRPLSGFRVGATKMHEACAVNAPENQALQQVAQHLGLKVGSLSCVGTSTIRV